MRINCAKCGKLHDSDLTPFQHNKVPDRKAVITVADDESATKSDIVEKEIITEFDCTGCGRMNVILLSWYVVGD